MPGLQGQPLNKKVMAALSLVVLGLTPSYIDWQDKPEQHKQIITFYAVAISMFWYGLLT
jgi:hypothetical protein